MSTSAVKPQVHGIFDPATWTVTYVVYEKPGSGLPRGNPCPQP